MELELTAPLAFVQQGRLECLTTPSLTITGLNKAREGGREASRRRDQCHRSPRAISFQIALSNCRGSFFFFPSQASYTGWILLRISMFTLLYAILLDRGSIEKRGCEKKKNAGDQSTE